MPASMLASLTAFLNDPAFSLGGFAASRAEALGALLGVWMVLCNLRVHPLGWLLAILSSMLYLLVFWEARLYGDASLQILFIVMAAWGWWWWRRGGTAAGGDGADSEALAGERGVRRLGLRGRLTALLAMAALWPAFGWLLWRFTNTDVPWWDAFPTAGSVVATVLLGLKCTENWPAWLVVNLVGAALFAWKGLWLTVGLYGIFAALSVVGWRAWTRREAAAAPQGGA